MTLSACALRTEEASGALTARALVRDDLPADGCTWHALIDGEPYALDPGSLQAVLRIADGRGSIDLHIDYRRTGTTRQVACGWNTTAEFPEISILTIR